MPNFVEQKTVQCKQCGTDIHIKYRKDRAKKFCDQVCAQSHLREHPRNRNGVAESFDCRWCGTLFTKNAGALRSYREKFGRDPLYCSIACSAPGRKRDGEAGFKITCIECSTDIPIQRRPDGTLDKRQDRRFCSTECRSTFRRKEYQKNNPDQQITRTTARHGYVRLCIPGKNGEPSRKDVLEHRYVMEQHLGRELLPTETVHHKNGIRDDNRYPENLELRTGNHGPGAAVTDIMAYIVEMATLYGEKFLSDTQRSDLAAVLDHARPSACAT